MLRLPFMLRSSADTLNKKTLSVAIKKDKKANVSNTFQKLRRNQLLPVVLALGFVIFLI